MTLLIFQKLKFISPKSQFLLTKHVQCFQKENTIPNLTIEDYWDDQKNDSIWPVNMTDSVLSKFVSWPKIDEVSKP